MTVAACFSQPVPAFNFRQQGFPPESTPRGQRVGATEICGNGIDDDGNGLIDEKDFTCYYKSTAAGCPVTSVIWVNTGNALYWVDPAGGGYKPVGTTNNSLYDIAWSSTGQLYGMNGFGIMELDPYTGQILSTQIIPGYFPANAMTGDEKGNLFLTATEILTGGTLGNMYVIKYSPATGQVTPIVNLTATLTNSGGDLTFLKGNLYLSSGNGKVAIINLANSSLSTVTINSTIHYSGFGLVTLGDGYLYITHNNSLYRVDPATWQGDVTPYYNFPTSGVGVNGLSTYAEHCNAPSCDNPGIVVTIPGSPPYCAGITLKAVGSGIASQGVVDWALPDGTQSTGAALQATISGVYTARYHHVPDDCGHDTSFTLALKDSCTCFPLFARVALPGDAEMCSFDTLLLKNVFHDDRFRYHWQDGSSEPTLMAHGPGIYWVDVSTWCNKVRDSIIIHPKQHGCELRFRAPNAFSPTGNSNTLFRPVVTGPLLQYEFVVYNRWGQQVFHTTNRSAGWDGRIKGSLQATGVFVWSCIYRFIGQPAIMQKGTVLLLR